MIAHTTTCSSWQLPREEAETLPTENLFIPTNAGNLCMYSCWNYIAQWLAPNCSLLPDYPTPARLSALFWGNNLTRQLSSQLSPIGSRCAILQKDAYVFIKLRCDWKIEWKPMHTILWYFYCKLTWKLEWQNVLQVACSEWRTIHAKPQ